MARVRVSPTSSARLGSKTTSIAAGQALVRIRRVATPTRQRRNPVLHATELAGFVGAALAGAAYVPQIWHLAAARCSAGISRLAFGVWLVASLLVLSHALAIGAEVFVVLGAVQVVATAVIVVYSTVYRQSVCEGHRLCPPSSEAAEHLASTAR